ncbi:unnamed protein product [Knipowitschia caucasica]|uniref:Uncharacterized protein n=1 Tax=Knipowitschia caucasica TaxID=637954 RepID=A0AAV2KMJ3_KNICA
MSKSCVMAASRDFYDEQPLHSPRPSRVRRIPGHLEDYEVGFSFQRPPQSPESWSTSSSHDDDEDRIQHLASAYQALGRQMRELQTEMSNVRLTQSAQPAKHRYAQEQQYSSMPQLQPLQSWHASETFRAFFPHSTFVTHSSCAASSPDRAS